MAVDRVPSSLPIPAPPVIPLDPFPKECPGRFALYDPSPEDALVYAAVRGRVDLIETTLWKGARIHHEKDLAIIR